MNPESRALLDAASGGDDPTGDDRSRVRARVLAQVAAGAAAGGGSAANASAAHASVGAKAGIGLGTKIFLAAVAIGVGAAGVAAWPRHDARAPSVERAVPGTPTITAVAATATTAATQSPGGAAVDVTDLPVAPASTHAASPSATAKTSAPPPKSATVASPDSLAEETALLGKAARANREGDSVRALALLDEHASRYPNGVLAEERAAQRVFVLCALGRKAEATTARAAFLRDRPHSPLAERVRGTCADDRDP